MTRPTARLLMSSVVLSAGAVGVLALAPTAAAGDGGRPLFAALSGTAEIPGPGDPDGMGTAAVRVNVGQGTVCFDIAVDGIAPATAAHIHRGSSSASGPVVLGLIPPTDGTSEGCLPVDRSFAKQLLQSPQDYYVNVHNAEFPGGAVRGQLGS